MAERCSSSHDRSEADQSHQRADRPGRKFRHDHGACDCNLVHAVYGGCCIAIIVWPVVSSEMMMMTPSSTTFPSSVTMYRPSRTIPTFRLVLPTVLSGPSTLNDISACFPR